MVYDKNTWRLIEHPPAQGSWNMAVDEAILESVYSGDSPPTLRLYAWQPACLSLGHAQPYAEVDKETLAANGWDIVRRPTGGRAILHVDELTYAVIAPETEPRVRGGVLESYLRLSQALLLSLQLLGLKPLAEEKESNGNKRKPNPVCFEVPSNYEITVNGKKDETAKTMAKDRLLAHATTVENELGQLITWQQASHAFQQAFSEILNLDLEPGNLSTTEIQRAQDLQSSKYGHPSWTERI